MATVTYETGTNRFERRIGRRLTIQPVDVTWVFPPGPGRNDVGREVPGLIVDVSVTGAAVDGPNDLALEPGTRAVLRFEGHESTVTVCRAAPSSQPDVARYGVEFTVLDGRLKERIYQIVGSGRPIEHDWKDNR